MLVRVVKFCLSSHRVTLALRSHEKVEFFHTNWWACLMDRLHHTRYNGITISTVCGSKFTVVWQVTSLVTRPSEIKQMGKKNLFRLWKPFQDSLASRHFHWPTPDWLAGFGSTLWKDNLVSHPVTRSCNCFQPWDKEILRNSFEQRISYVSTSDIHHANIFLQVKVIM